MDNNPIGSLDAALAADRPSRGYSLSRRLDGMSSTDPSPRFFLDSIEEAAAGERRGVEKVMITYPHNPHSKPVFVVTDEHRQRWPDAYAAFQASQAPSERS